MTVNKVLMCIGIIIMFLAGFMLVPTVILHISYGIPTWAFIAAFIIGAIIFLAGKKIGE